MRYLGLSDERSPKGHRSILPMIEKARPVLMVKRRRNMALGMF